MSETHPLYCAIGYAYNIYQAVSFKWPFKNEASICYRTRVYKGDSYYETGLRDITANYIKREMGAFLDRKEIRKDLQIVEFFNPGVCCAHGTNLFKNSDAVVMLAPGFYEQDKEACHWVLKHEISHIKNNDAFTIPLMTGVISVAAAVFASFTMSMLPATLLLIAVDITTRTLYTRWREGKADDLATENSSAEELLGGRRFLLALKQMNLHKRQSFWEKVKVTPRGNNTFDIYHPSLTSRIAKIEKVLREKGVFIDNNRETIKIDNLKSFLIDQKIETKPDIEIVAGHPVFYKK